MAAGKPVVATRSGGASEMVVNGETGFLIPIGNVEEGKVALEQLIRDSDLREQLGESGRTRVLNTYSLEAFEKKIINHLWQHLREN